MAADNVTHRAYRALILDDDPMFRRLAGESLRAKGFLSDTAKDPNEGIFQIESHNYHLLIFDVSIGKGNQEWLVLLGKLRAEGKVNSSLVVVISDYVTTGKSVHEAFIEFQADDVIEKSGFHVDTFGERMHQFTEKKMKLNPALRISWKHGPAEARSALVNLKIGGRRVKPENEDFPRLQEELEDLFCRLFWRADSILVSRLPVGRSGAGVVKVQPVVRGIAHGAVVVKFGDRADIEKENANYEEYVSGMLGGNRSPSVSGIGHTRFLGGIVYSFFGAEEFEPFASFYASASQDDIRGVLDHLFLSTCARWYSAQMSAEHYDLAEEYRTWLRMTPENLQGAWKELKTVQGAAVLKFQSLTAPVTIKNPIPLVENPLMTQTYRCITHGDLNGGNILVDSDRKTWLIDFFKTGYGHVLRDHAFLDVYTRCAILGPDEATLDERLQLEQALLQLRRVDARGVPIGQLQSENLALQKAFATSLHLRSLAAKNGHHATSTDMPDYDVASTFYATNMIRFYHLATVQKEHGILAAGLLAERLGL